MVNWAEAATQAVVRKESESEQGSEAWLKWRGKGLGSSDAAVLLDWSPWKNILQLWQEKMGLWKPTFGAFQMKAMERGKELEPVIRKWYENEKKALFPDAIDEDATRKFRRASFDGINRTFVNPEDGSIGRIVEIKAPNAKDHEGAKQGAVPLKYVAQVQWLMLVGNLPWADYVSFGSDGTYAVVPMKADPLIQMELSVRSDLFWGLVETQTSPLDSQFPKWFYPITRAIDLSCVDTIVAQMDFEIGHAQVEDQEIEALVTDALNLKIQAESANARFELAKEKLKKILGTQTEMTCGEAVFGWETRKGNVDYKVIPELASVNLEQYRKKEIKAFYFERKKN